MTELHNTAAIILAAGKGTRIGSHLPKVVYPLAGKPMITYIIKTLGHIPVHDIFVVTGYRSEDVRACVGSSASFVSQTEQLGTGHALGCALAEIPVNIDTVLVINGDDSAFYEANTLRRLLQKHEESHSVMTILTTRQDNPTGLGRIIRNKDGKIIDIREEKEATDDEKQINEVNIGCYVFNVDWVSSYLPRLAKSPSGEYYIVDLLKLAQVDKRSVTAVELKNAREWHGVNTLDELERSNQAMKEKLAKNAQPSVYIIDLDNTILQTEQLKHVMEERAWDILLPSITRNEFRQQFWGVYHQYKSKNGWTSIPDFSLEVSEHFHAPHLSNSIKRMFYTLPFSNYVHKSADELLELLHSTSKVVIFGDGDLVYLPIKIKSIGNEDYIDDTFVYEQKKSRCHEITEIYQGYRQIVVDDQKAILAEFKRANPDIITIWISQGPYSEAQAVDSSFQPDFSVPDIGKLEDIVRELS